MPNPYTSTPVVGYNATPPSDDGTQTPNNQITYGGTRGIKTNIGDPLNTFAGAVDANVTAAFGLVTPVHTNSDFPVTSSTALTNITGLTYNLSTGTYTFDVYLTCTDAAAGGVQAAINCSIAPTSIIYDGWVLDSNTIIGMTHATSNGAAVCNVATTATSGIVIQIKGSLVVSGAATLTVQFAQHSSNGTASTVKAGSWMKVV